MNSAELKKVKRAVRAEVLAGRDAMSAEERARAGLVIASSFLALEEVDHARRVMAFWSFGSEVTTGPILGALHRRGTTVILPRITRGELEPCTWAPGEPLTSTPFGAQEPESGEVVDPATIDVIAVPAVAFDRRGHRVGYGGGYYDRFLPTTRPSCLRVGLGLALQLIEGDLPAGSFDLRVDLVVTEQGVHRCPPREP